MASETALVIVLLAMCAIQLWVVWYTVGHLTQANRRQAALLEEAMRHIWTLRASESPERAAVAGQLESILRPPERRAQPGVMQIYPDDDAMGRS